MFSTVLVANRGEIAVRVLRTCHELGIRTVLAHSTVDADSTAARLADQTVQIGPADAKRSYLNHAAIVQAALATGAEAIHPGYGFLSEDPDLAEACELNGITFIGPPADVLARLGHKGAARAAATEAGVPVLPGNLRPARSSAEAFATAAEIGYPVIVKAVAGGGGRGMAVVTGPDDFPLAYERTRSAALSLFGDGDLYVEKYLSPARHVEVQVLADGHGGVVALGARDCSVQRRRQKLIEETPPPGIPDSVLETMYDAATGLARKAGYLGAGTFEFLVDDDHRFYFLEANCRIQVEHPVTEQVTGIDLVRQQILVAAGLPMEVRAEDRPHGVAMECRINAEDPARDFMPTAGVLDEVHLPGGPFTRVDSDARSGMRISPSYDSLVAKVIVWAGNRDHAVARMRRALTEIRVRGDHVTTTADFLRRVLEHRSFAEGAVHTGLVGEILTEPAQVS